MKTLLAALALAALTSAALAGPVALTEAQLDAVTAGDSRDKGGGPGALTGGGAAAPYGGSAIGGIPVEDTVGGDPIVMTGPPEA